MSDALMHVIDASGVGMSDALIFLPSRRAVRAFERAVVEKNGGAAILPRLVALGEGADELTDADDLPRGDDIITNTERVVVLAKLLAADGSIGNLATALPIARDLVRMSDYLENEGVDAADIDWGALVDEKYAAHFQAKAKLLNILSSVMPAVARGRVTETARRNADIRAWIGLINNYKLVVVCASTASVPATADLMAAVAAAPHGRIILSGKIAGRASDFELATNPYNSEYKFLTRCGAVPDDVIQIDTGASAIDFMNAAFGNAGEIPAGGGVLRHCHLIECARESEEAAAVAEIAARAVAENKSVLVITPDAAGNQRIATAFAARQIPADFSGGMPGTMTAAGRAILNMFDEWADAGGDTFDRLYAAAGHDLFEMIAGLIADAGVNFTPQFDIETDASMAVLAALRDMSRCVTGADIILTAADARAFVADTLAGVSVRGAAPDEARVIVIGTIESRMQTADVVILTGLNEGMFPARGYENAWLPRNLCAQIGLPPADRKVALMSLDFMNLSCGGDVYWMRSRTAGGAATTESRFLSRVASRRGEFDTTASADILSAVRAHDDPPPRPLNYSAPTPPADWSDVYVTELELLIHNPYAFYARHILRLRPLDDYWVGPDARTFGNLVHSVIETARDIRPDALVAGMDRRASDVLGGAHGVVFHFWHKRFLEIAPVVANALTALKNAAAEIGGRAVIGGRTIRARADRVWDGGVMDIKTGAAPNKKQLLDGMMPQLGLEAYMLQSGGFPIKTTAASKSPIMVFLQLKNGDARPIVYDADTCARMITAAVDKTIEMVNMYSVGCAPYEYRETSDQKYRAYDDLARARDL